VVDSEPPCPPVVLGDPCTTDPGTFREKVPNGEQTVPFKQVGNIYPVACPEQDEYWVGQDESCNEGLPGGPESLLSAQSVSESSTKGGGKSGQTPVVGTVTELVGTNPEVSSMFLAGGLIGLVAMRRRSKPRRRSTS
jgi:hypothetical protein